MIDEKIEQAVKAIERAGFKLSCHRGKLIVFNEPGLAGYQAEYIKRHEKDIVAWLAKNRPDPHDPPLPLSSEEKIRRAVEELVADCLDWYEADLVAISELEHRALKDVILDYLSKRDGYRASQNHLTVDSYGKNR